MYSINAKVLRKKAKTIWFFCPTEFCMFVVSDETPGSRKKQIVTIKCRQCVPTHWKADFCGVISFHKIYECTFDFSEFLDLITGEILTIKITNILRKKRIFLWSHFISFYKICENILDFPELFYQITMTIFGVRT